MDLRSDLAAQETGPANVNISLASLLIETFNWSETAQGHAYWEAQYWALLGMLPISIDASTPLAST